MTAAEILMSESQERMLAIVRPADLDEVLALAARWEIAASPIGIVTDGGTCSGSATAARWWPRCRAASLRTGAPRYRASPSPSRRPRRGVGRPARAARPASTPPPCSCSCSPTRRIGDRPRCTSSTTTCSSSTRWSSRATTAPLLRIRGTDKALAVSTDGDGARCALDARRGAARIVWEAALNVAVTGARPFALVDNLNFGNPEKPEVMWQFVETVEGLSTACEAMGIPVVGGNVSFYNETDGVRHPLRPLLWGCSGSPIPAPRGRPDSTAPRRGWRSGCSAPRTTPTSPRRRSPDSCSAAAGAGRRRPTLKRGTPLVARTVELAGWCPVLHDVSAGDLAVALAEIAIRSGVGVIGRGARDGATCSPKDRTVWWRWHPAGADLTDHVPARRIGTMGGDSIDFGAEGSVTLERSPRTPGSRRSGATSAGPRGPRDPWSRPPSRSYHMVRTSPRG